MRIATVTTPHGTAAAVQADAGWRALPAPDLSALLADGDAWEPGDLLADAVPTLPLPRPGKVICCGLNYGDHIAEMGRDLPTHPTLFAKHADTLLADGQDIRLPAGLQIDWEAELAVVVGRELRHADEDQARAAIAGYTVANDISVRDWQRRTPQWFQGKAWDATTPLGPVVVTPDEVDPEAGLEVICRVNGVEHQRGSTKTLVFSSAALLAYVSTFTVLRPGDIVLTGTPGGVGMGMEPPVYLADGDVVETEIPGIGALTNTVRLA
ncbi:5-oxopent-3-ene-1,2,5-tricarboxylatedecarboxylase [Xylanimonas cellulosilytica DSM 15894]|uniref:5-oxopent-3-ene-1,2, 5-tricarboxylatedecarboxylase n=1 Tax=Xylanimonas cellulosilytica (strain DSM 15894 / JCM 12276 / CECT 5975 / KCTC 9989 / LMG 20990 / NBRC 107835 / XIL07) TaxID=446471 RepID=D1BUV3_XYLCX|nr:fumarylacetoacetate hydrolase family protein [Xylanimonas cellulosilytica]ACZ29344.1 5-oxopent-3-ene-1,2,5-tricarboxylatedecarboxylase [Xylanimonas cellulosilytica DSM 15894]